MCNYIYIPITHTHTHTQFGHFDPVFVTSSSCAVSLSLLKPSIEILCHSPSTVALANLALTQKKKRSAA